MNQTEKAMDYFEHNYNCAQAVACAYAQELGLPETQLYRLSEGFGGGLGHLGHTCGACNAMVMIASYMVCPDMKNIGETKEHTYSVVQEMVRNFEAENQYLNCADIIKDGDTTLMNGKKQCCRTCIATACRLLANINVAG